MHSTRLGSSPRGRGKLMRDLEAWEGYGLIPARAGKTGGLPGEVGAIRAHPRAGGENGEDASSATPNFGSSPRGRGKRSQGAEQCFRVGLIPARAGKTQQADHVLHLVRAHPRAGGENTF